MASGSKGDIVSVLASDLATIADEVQRRSGHQHALVNLTVLSSGAVAAFVLEDPDRVAVALIAPFLTFALGAAWLDHGRTINALGLYRDQFLRPHLMSIAGLTLPPWTGWRRSRPGVSRLVYVVPLMLVFLGPAVVGLVYSWAAVGGTLSKTLWATGAMLTGLSILAWTHFFLLYPWGSRREVSRARGQG